MRVCECVCLVCVCVCDCIFFNPLGLSAVMTLAQNASVKGSCLLFLG